MRTSCPPTCLSTRYGPSKSRRRTTKSGSMATMPIRAKKFICRLTWNASGWCATKPSTAPPSTCGSAATIRGPSLHGPCRATIHLSESIVRRPTTTPTTMTSTVRAGISTIIPTCTTTPTTAASLIRPLRCRRHPSRPARRNPAIVRPARTATAKLAMSTFLPTPLAASQPAARR